MYELVSRGVAVYKNNDENNNPKTSLNLKTYHYEFLCTFPFNVDFECQLKVVYLIRLNYNIIFISYVYRGILIKVKT